MKPLFDEVVWARRIRVRIAELGLSYDQAAAEMGVARGSVMTYARAESPATPNVEAFLRIELWLAKTAHALPMTPILDPDSLDGFAPSAVAAVGRTKPVVGRRLRSPNSSMTAPI